MGLYTPEYTMTKEYCHLICSPPLGEGQSTRWKWLRDFGIMFGSSLTDATMPKSPALRIVHTLLSGSIMGWISGVNYISSSEFQYLVNMVDRLSFVFCRCWFFSSSGFWCQGMHNFCGTILHLTSLRDGNSGRRRSHADYQGYKPISLRKL